ncbi:MAG: glycine/betaine/sarcosine/D-proline family reductase selenoprotein B [Hyphomicrobiales bacterium]|nr:glycine/betaine/sarcosine/D-proline family reductase selenoprotein B [Hyphomicrobiales bacterium]
MTVDDDALGFAPLHDSPVPYMLRTRTYYQALGYTTPYRWAQYTEVPFAALPKPLSECRVALITTAAPYQPDKGDQGPGAPYNSAAKFYKVYSLSTEGEPDVRISHVGIDRKHTTAEDPNTWLPLAQMKRAAAEGRIGSVAPRFHGAPTNRSHRTTLDQDCPELLARLREDAVDAAILAANCPVCHQTIALSARHLEAGGLPTVVMGCAKDIVEHAGVARFLFSDFPLGNAAGRPHDVASQAKTLDLALDVLESARGPRTTVQSPLRWSEDPDWKLDFCNIERIPPEELARLRQSFDEQKEIAKGRRAEDGLKVKAAE